MATASKKKVAKKSAPPKIASKKVAKKAAKKKAASKKATAKKTTAGKKAAPKKNKLGVKNSLVNNINARKKKGSSRPKSKKTVDKTSYAKMQSGWK